MASVNSAAGSVEDHSNDTSAGDAPSARESLRWFWMPKILSWSFTLDPALSICDWISGSMRSICGDLPGLFGGGVGEGVGVCVASSAIIGGV